MNLLELTNTGIRSLVAHKLRSILSILGIVFGVAAVISMLSIGEGAKLEAMEQIKLMGINNITIRALKMDEEMRQKAARNYSMGLTVADARRIREMVPHIEMIAPLKEYQVRGYTSDKETSARLVGTTDSYLGIMGLSVSKGRFITFFDVADNKRVCVLGAGKRAELFPLGDFLGQMVSINGTWYTVIGDLENRETQKGKETIVKVNDINNDIYVPVSTVSLAMDKEEEKNKVTEIATRIKDSGSISDSADMIRKILKRLHNEVEDYEVVVPQELLKQKQKTQMIFNIVMGCIAGISLLVGGIGIMNIMLANVTERTREIGIRRALGADRGSILKQFLIESVVLTVTGGLIGVTLGYVTAKIITYLAHWTTVVSIITVIVACGISITVGIVFGLYPAYKAAQMHPIEALKYE